MHVFSWSAQANSHLPTHTSPPFIYSSFLPPSLLLPPSLSPPRISTKPTHTHSKGACPSSRSTMPPSRLAYTPVHNDKPNQSPASDPTSSNSSYSESPAKAMVMVKKVKKGKRDRHRYKAQPLSPLPYLSNEIWGMILSYLKRPFPRIGSPVPVKKFHQNDLASCMRVNTVSCCLPYLRYLRD